MNKNAYKASHHNPQCICDNPIWNILDSILNVMQLYEHSVFVEYIFRNVFNFFFFFYILDEVKTQMMQIRLTIKHVNTSWILPQT